MRKNARGIILYANCAEENAEKYSANFLKQEEKKEASNKLNGIFTNRSSKKR